MGLLLIIGICIVLCLLIEYIYNLYLGKLPKEKRDELIRRQTEMRCSNCSSRDFEVIGMKGNIKFQCKYCKKIR